MPDSAAVTLQAATTETGAGQSAALDLVAGFTSLDLTLVITAASGTSPTLAVTVETSDDGATDWQAVTPHADDKAIGATFESAATTGVQRVTFPGCRQYVRVSWAIGGGSPSFTFSVVGTKVFVYATPADFAVHGIRSPWLNHTNGVSDARQDRVLRAKTDHINSYFGAYDLPPTAWPDNVRAGCCYLAICDLLTTDGHEPDDDDASFAKRCEEFQAWLEAVAAGNLDVPGYVDASPAEVGGAAYVHTNARRGWSTR